MVQGRFAFILQGLCGYEQVFFDGKLLPRQTNIQYYSRCFRNATYPIPSSLMPKPALKGMLVIRLVRTDSFVAPTLKNKITVVPLQQAEAQLWKGNVLNLGYALFSLIVGLLFLSLYLCVYPNLAYYTFSMLSILYFLYRVSSNEYLYTILDLAPLYIRVSQTAFILLPSFFFIFFLSFFPIHKISFASIFSFRRLCISEDKNKKGKKDENVQALANFYLGISALIAVAVAISPNLGQVFKVELFWFLLQLPVFFVYFLLAYKTIRLWPSQCYSLLLAAGCMAMSWLYGLLVEDDISIFALYEFGGQYCALAFLCLQLSFSGGPFV